MYYVSETFLHLVLICPQLRNKRQLYHYYCCCYCCCHYLLMLLPKRRLTSSGNDQVTRRAPSLGRVSFAFNFLIIISSEQCRIPFVQSKHHEQLLQGNSLKKLDSKIKLFTLHCLSTARLSFQKANSEWHRPRAKTPTENCLAQAQSSWLNEDVIIFTGECSVKDFAAQSLTAWERSTAASLKPGPASWERLESC